LAEALSLGQSTSAVYRLALSPTCPPLPVQTKSKLFKASPPGTANTQPATEPDFLMATHSIMP
jgi:hypothetical protein